MQKVKLNMSTKRHKKNYLKHRLLILEHLFFININFFFFTLKHFITLKDNIGLR